MKKLTIHIDDNYGEAVVLGFVGNKGKNISAKTIVLEHENTYKLRSDGELTDMRALEVH